MFRSSLDTSIKPILCPRKSGPTQIDFSQSSEQATREMAVNPIIGALGWDTMKPEEVAREFLVRGGKVDYCLRGQMHNLVLIEVKRAGANLTEHQEQLLRYAFDEGVPLAALTDGLVWWLYLPMAGGSWEQRRFFSTNLRAQRPADAASAIHRFLNRDGVICGEALEKAKREFESQERDRRVRGALQRAWRQTLSDPQGLLRDLLAETVSEISGHRPGRETITEFLQGLSGDRVTENMPSVPSAHSKDHHSLEHESERSVSSKVRKKKASKKMSTRVPPAFALLALHERLAGFPLGVEAVELLVEPLFRALAGVERAV